MPCIMVTQDAYDWFQKTRKIKKDGRKLKIQENELIILMLNMWEAGNLAKDQTRKFEHENGVFYRSDT